jgi:hypothetical protein
MFTKLKTIRNNINSPQHIIDMASQYQAILNTRDRNAFLSEIQSFIDKNKQYYESYEKH